VGLPIGLALGALMRMRSGQKLRLRHWVLYPLLAWLASAILDCMFVACLSSAQAGAIDDQTYCLIGIGTAAVLVALSLVFGSQGDHNSR
ncbi:MAG: hypothetical protein KIS61_33120, partial [Candidatus Eremiobacteraeota bacterium]|nr:hypothetical protein [Candidatus Eremiobacteraeota bacterium]